MAETSFFVALRMITDIDLILVEQQVLKNICSKNGNKKRHSVDECLLKNKGKKD